ncbi:glycosyltransferase [Thermococcus atlanticus]
MWVLLLRLMFILIQAVFLAGVAPILSCPFVRTGKTKSETLKQVNDPLRVAVVLPFYREQLPSIMRTAKSIAGQNYPPELITVYILVERMDDVTKSGVPILESFLSFSGFNVRTIYTNSSHLGKPDALNQALPYITEDVVMIFDADDIVPMDYISLAVEKINRGAGAVTTKVYRIGESIHSKFLALDTFIWYDIYLPVYTAIIGYAPMSGEGLTVRRDVLEKIGGFPGSLTEDAYLTIELAKNGERMEYLDSVYIVEHAPATFKALINQRMRWFKGYYECLRGLWKSRKALGYKKLMGIGLTYMGPVISMATTASYTLLFLYLGGILVGSSSLVGTIENSITGLIYYIAMFMFLGGNLFFTLVIAYHFSDTVFESYTPYIYIAFAYWYIIGLVAFFSIFSPRRWYKTERDGNERVPQDFIS